MSTVDHGNRHVWPGTSPRTVHCAYMFCQARRSRADVERLRAETEAARSTRTTIEYQRTD